MDYQSFKNAVIAKAESLGIEVIDEAELLRRCGR